MSMTSHRLDLERQIEVEQEAVRKAENERKAKEGEV